MFPLHIYKTDCKSIGNDPTENPIQMYCNDGEYNVIGAIWFQTPEQSVRYVPTDHRYFIDVNKMIFICFKHFFGGEDVGGESKILISLDFGISV